MKKIAAVTSLAGIFIIGLVATYAYTYKTFVCNGSIYTHVTYMGAPLKDENSTAKISFSFSWDAFSKELDLSDIDELATPARHINFYNMNKDDQKGMLNSKGKTINFYYSADAQRDKARSTFHYEGSTLDFDKNSKFIVIEIINNDENKLLSTYTKRTVRAQCERDWF
ncbi:hypothetical protein ICN19_00010 [Polynucleobacter sp. AP-Capit-er-40B-B4]|uniref:hypothetical protein n=1 Tax=Polynucleobacter sp. AP-Capit-er-40B-B4 TaxID=2576927 RepID=UPI001C0C6820|nr:hypothetical protein [Polynucleobacter sp. AP-Capit-er-40B-B4]MBU3580395.1 hypothetical protein [Polynucleobacter sp. AP-Capit-er-40B-B4]